LQRILLRLETKLAISTSGKFFWHVLGLPIEFFTQRYAGDIGSRVAINDEVASLLSGELATALLNFVLIAFYAVLMLHYDVLLTVIGIVIAMLNILALRFVSRRRVDANQKLQQEHAKLIGLRSMACRLSKREGGRTRTIFRQWAGYQASA
jgi:ABC-type bacteriocin/lantibiotic exporter with double-glycine peptidase domain